MYKVQSVERLCMKILVADNCSTFLDDIVRVLTSHGHEVDTSKSINDAIKMAGRDSYDFALIDCTISGKAGIRFLESADISRGTKTIMMTSSADRGNINRMFDLGAAGYLIKPFDDQELLMHLRFHSSK